MVDCCAAKGKFHHLPPFVPVVKLVRGAPDLDIIYETAHVLAFESATSALVPSWTLMSA